jgi:hypothetical protein
VPVLSAALGTGDGRVVGVVVTLTRGVSVAWSRRPDVDRRGAVTRRYTALPLEDGVATGVWPAPASAALLRVEAGDLVAIGRVQVTEEVGSSQVPLAQTVSRSCSGRAFELLRLNLADVARGAAASVGRGQAEIARVRAVGCRAVEAHALMFVTVELSDGTEVQTEAESFREANGDGVLWGAVRPVPQGRGGTYPRFASFVDARAGLRRTVVFCAPGGATAHLVRRSVGGPAVVLAQARLAPDGIGVGRIARPGDDADQGELDIVVRDAAGAVRERVPLPPPEQWLPDRAVDGPVVPTGPGTSP